MKTVKYMCAALAMAAVFTSCEDAKEPVYQAPTTFTVNEPAMQNILLETTGDMDDKSTFNIFCSQPDYGFSAVCEYGAQVSLTKDFVDGDAEAGIAANYLTLSNVESSLAAMSFRTYDLAVAMNQLLGITNPDEYAAYDGPSVLPVYFRATCRIPGVAGSEIVSSNVVSYNKVQLNYAVPTAGIIFIAGHVTNLATGVENNFKEPSAAYADFYKDFQLVEPVIGCKLYAGVFQLKECTGGADNVDNCAQWRFFTELNGWGDIAVQVGSHEGDFYVEPITDLFVNDFYSGDAVYGQGNWGVYTDSPDPDQRVYTLVVGLQDKNKPKVWFMKGNWDVEIELDNANMNVPKFVAPAE